jgi:hypothetical protein
MLVAVTTEATAQTEAQGETSFEGARPLDANVRRPPMTVVPRLLSGMTPTRSFDRGRVRRRDHRAGARSGTWAHQDWPALGLRAR